VLQAVAGVQIPLQQRRCAAQFPCSQQDLAALGLLPLLKHGDAQIVQDMPVRRCAFLGGLEPLLRLRRIAPRKFDFSE
jgi:hypothetical protein